MTLSDLPTAADLARFSLAAQHPLTLNWADTSERLSRLAGGHVFDLQLATDLDLAGQRAAFLNAGPAAPEYLNHWVYVHSDLHAMLSIRFKGLDVSKPFMEVSVTSRPVVPADLAALCAAAQVYHAFRPPRLRFWSAAPQTVWADLAPDRRVLAAPLPDLRGGAVPGGLTLRPTVDAAQYAEACAAYASVDADHPGHPEQARILSEDDLHKTIAAGTMFDVLWQGQWAGYVGTQAYSQLGLDAQVIQEVLLAPHVRGRRLGTALSTLLARHLPGERQVLSGTIHGHNRGALQAARGAGRHDVGGWWWVPLG
ncbi:hypothetical protein K7W42_09520 [Deinococcus sp. HMF7604]|uniref:hypothetical protein n=1 Tax=Deinococcus betulae TaxID=2873312 RepID=UPI001CCDACF3|nr:hypothetical protein [Deinococcus betulae]MBZ9751100.1 hypothetical protein [Deinococcus betulae]